MCSRLMVPRNVEHLTAVMNLSLTFLPGDEHVIVDLLQINGSTPKEGWILQDGKPDMAYLFQP